MDYPYTPAKPVPEEFRAPEGLGGDDPSWSVPWFFLAGWFLLCDLAIVPCVETFTPRDWPALLVLVCMGAIAAQFGILPAFLVLGTGRYSLRLALTWSAAIAVVGSFCLGGLFARWLDGEHLRNEDVRDTAVFLLMLPILSLALETPLWVFRVFLGYRFGRDTDSCLAERKLAIRDFLLATALVALALAAARGAAYILEDSEFWVGLGVAIVALVSASAILVLPSVWFALRLANPALAVLCAALTMFAVASTFVIVMLFVAPGRPSAWDYIGLMVIAVTFALSLSAPFWLARLQGYRLIRPGDAAS